MCFDKTQINNLTIYLYKSKGNDIVLSLSACFQRESVKPEWI